MTKGEREHWDREEEDTGEATIILNDWESDYYHLIIDISFF